VAARPDGVATLNKLLTGGRCGQCRSRAVPRTRRLYPCAPEVLSHLELHPELEAALLLREEVHHACTKSNGCQRLAELIALILIDCLI
jgi:hypothetical protein